MDMLYIFHNHIVNEAATGSVNCGFDFNVLFETYYADTHEKIEAKIKNDDVLIPTLIINNMMEFNNLLKRYVELSLEFYPRIFNYSDEIFAKENIKEKFIMTHLWSNATYDDFKDPVSFLKRRISFLESDICEISHDCGFSPTLNGNLSFNIEKDTIFNETPYKIVIKVTNDQGQVYTFPEVKFAICDDTVYFYAIQNGISEENDYKKKVNRALFKIGEGFDSKQDNYEAYEEGNLKDVSSSFLVALNMAVSYLHNLGYEKMCVSSILIIRWNAKKIALQKKMQHESISEEAMNRLLEGQDNIQRNLTDKFLRTFLRLKHHYDCINIENMPFDIDSNLHLNINGGLISNNNLLNETANLVKLNNKNKNI